MQKSSHKKEVKESLKAESVNESKHLKIILTKPNVDPNDERIMNDPSITNPSLRQDKELPSSILKRVIDNKKKQQEEGKHNSINILAKDLQEIKSTRVTRQNKNSNIEGLIVRTTKTETTKEGKLVEQSIQEKINESVKNSKISTNSLMLMKLCMKLEGLCFKKKHEVFKDFFSQLTNISAIDRNKVTQKLCEIYSIDYSSNTKLYNGNLKLEKTLKSLKNKFGNSNKSLKKRTLKSYQKMIESVISKDSEEELNKLSSYKDILNQEDTESVTPQSHNELVTSYSNLQEMFDDESQDWDIPSYNCIKEYISVNSNKKKSKQSSALLSVDSALVQTKACLKKLHKYCHLNLLEIRKDFSNDSAFLQVLMILLKKLKIIELYKQKKSNLEMFGESNETDDWYYWVKLKNLKPINFDKE